MAFPSAKLELVTSTEGVLKTLRKPPCLAVTFEKVELVMVRVEDEVRITPPSRSELYGMNEYHSNNDNKKNKNKNKIK
jgi:hypothetical protein